MTEADPDLLSLLEKAANPLREVGVKLKIHGVYAPPQQWKITDQANPNIFGYTLKILNHDFIGGKIQPRKLTEKELKELEQKNKKGGKKQTKQEEKPVQIDHIEEERKQRQWNALSEAQKFHRTQEDPYKAFSLSLNEKHKQFTLPRDKIEQLQSKIVNNSIEVILIRKPQINEEEIQKLKKSKPKNLNLGQLYAANYSGKVNCKSLEIPGSKKIVQRIKISLSGHIPDDGVKIQCENCYVYLEIQFSHALTPEVKEIKPLTSQIIPSFPTQKQISPIAKLREQICKSIRAISQQYLICFSKQKQHTEQKRHTNPSNISTLRLNQINKKKQIFLTQFVNSGKFGILKQRISKLIKGVVIDKFRKEKQSQIFTSTQINQTLSELGVFFQEEFIKIIDELMISDNTAIHEDLVLGYEHSRQLRKNLISPIVNQTEVQRQTRLAAEYEILQKEFNEDSKHPAQKHYLNILIVSNYSLEAKESYAKFCLKIKKYAQAYILYKEIADESGQDYHRLVQAILLMDRRRKEQALQLLTKMMKDQNCTVLSKININLLLSFMFERQGQRKECQKYLAIAERYYKIKNNPHMRFIPIENPYQLPKPKVPKPQHYISQLSHGQSQQIRLNFINILAQLNLFTLVGEYLDKVDQSNRKTILEVQSHVYNNKFDEALQKMQQLLKKSDNIRNMDYLLLKSQICFKSDLLFECQQIFLQILQLKPNSIKMVQIYLRLGYIYLSRKSWQDGKQIFQKAVQNKYNCSVAWFGLGIANLNLLNFNEAEQALNLSNIYNPLSKDIKLYQDQINQYQTNKRDSFTDTLS